MGIYDWRNNRGQYFDYFEPLAALVLEMHPDYRITFRHYGFDDLETVMYVE